MQNFRYFGGATPIRTVAIYTSSVVFGHYLALQLAISIVIHFLVFPFSSSFCILTLQILQCFVSKFSKHSLQFKRAKRCVKRNEFGEVKRKTGLSVFNITPTLERNSCLALFNQRTYQLTKFKLK